MLYINNVIIRLNHNIGGITFLDSIKKVKLITNNGLRIVSDEIHKRIKNEKTFNKKEFYLSIINEI